LLTKTIITGVLLASLGGGAHYFGKEPLHSFLNERLTKLRVKKQIIPIKVKTLPAGKKLVYADSAPVIEYTFFKTLTAPQAGPYLGLNRSILVNATQASATRPPPATIRKTIPTPVIKRDGPYRPSKTKLEFHQTDGPKMYMVQVSSFRELNWARAMENQLNKNGFSSFLIEVDIPGKGVWYRVYLGKYSNREDALLAAESAKLNHRLSAVVHQAG